VGGFDLVSRANNHAGDFGPLGAQITSRYVRERGLVEAGVGNSLSRRARRGSWKRRRAASR
jgi:poly-gamma-glutamate synthesis protein (capsule biosynthesis protein)